MLHFSKPLERKSHAPTHTVDSQVTVAKKSEAYRRTSASKNNIVGMMSGEVANYCLGMSRSAIVKSSTLLASVWQIFRQPYAFQTSGSHLLATGYMVRFATARCICARITDTSKSTRQADGSSVPSVVEKTWFTLERSGTTCHIEGLVIEHLDTENPGGVPFMEGNDL